MKLSEQLKKGKALIENPDNWLQGLYSDNLRYFENSTCFCSTGAALKALGAKHVLDMMDINPITSAIAKANNFGSEYDVIRYNDNHTHAEVMVMWDKAIEMAEKEEK